MTLVKQGYTYVHYEYYVSLLDDFCLVQGVSEPTRGDNIGLFAYLKPHSCK